MNKGIKQANGEYCLFFNSGDCLNGNCLKEAVLQLMGDVIVGRIKYGRTLNRILSFSPEEKGSL